MEEIWKDIDGYEGIYQVSNIGNVRSLNWGKRGIVKNLYLKKQNKGYCHVELAKDGARKAYTVHRLVACAFIENPNQYPCINHKDENKTNNRVENLEWCTQAYNTRYSIQRNRQIPGNRKIGMPYKYKSPVSQVNKNGETVKIWENIAEVGRRNGWRTSSIIDCCNGKRKHAYGYIWRFAS